MTLQSRILALQQCCTRAEVRRVLPKGYSVSAWLMLSGECEAVTVSGSGYAKIISTFGGCRRVNLGDAVEQFEINGKAVRRD